MSDIIHKNVKGSLVEAQRSTDSAQTFALLIHAVKNLNDAARDDRKRAAQAYGLLAETMFAVVRLEIAQATDAIINNALLVKREVTGSGKASFALNVTGTLVMLAGNVLTGGGMTLLGNLLVAAGEVAQGAASNDVAKTFTGVLHTATGIAASTTGEGRAAFSDQRQGGYQFATGPSDGSRSATDGIVELTNTAGEAATDLLQQVKERLGGDEAVKVGTFTVTRKKTAWIEHGAGGTSAITHDVQTAMANAYAASLSAIGTELAGGKLGRFLTQITAYQKLNASSNLHPVTQWVVQQGLAALGGAGGLPAYRALQGGSGMLGLASTLEAAKKAVSRSCAIMSEDFGTGGTLTEAEPLLAKLKTESLI